MLFSIVMEALRSLDSEELDHYYIISIKELRTTSCAVTDTAQQDYETVSPKLE